MAKLYKIELYIADYNNIYDGADHIIDSIDNGRGLYDVFINCFDKQEAEVDWTDEIDLIYDGANKQTYDKYFEM